MIIEEICWMGEEGKAIMINFRKSVFRNMRIGKRFFLIFFCLSFVPMIIIGSSIHKKTIHIVESKVGQNCIGINNGIRGQYNFLFKEIDDFTVELAYNNQLQQLLRVSKSEGELSYDNEGLIQDYLRSNVLLKKDGIIKTGIRLVNGQSVNYDIDYNNYIKASSSNFISDEIYNKALAANGELVWTSLVEKDLNNLFGYKDTHMAFQVSRVIKLTKDAGECIGVLSIVYSPKILSQVYDELFYSGDVYLVDEEGYMLYSNVKDSLFEKLPFYEQIRELRTEMEDDIAIPVRSSVKDDILLTYSLIPESNWGVVYTTPYSLLTGEINAISSWLIQLSIILAIVAALATYLFSKTITKPLNRLVEATKMVKKGIYEPIQVGKDRDEIHELTLEFNDMIYKIDDLIHEVYETQIREKDAKLKALQGRINPHFLYNTLDSMRWLARARGNVEISHRLQILSNLFRLILKDDCITTTFEDEIKYTEYYLFFMLNNFKDKLNVEWQVDAKVKNYRAIKLLLQPIIENAIKHGMYQDRRLTIDIAINILDTIIEVVIRDDGKGFDCKFNACENFRLGSNHIGLGNIQERIHECFGSAYGLRIHSTINLGTEVRILLPAILEEKKHA